MKNDINIHERLSDLLYQDMLDLASREECAELEGLLEKYDLKGLEREKIVARLEEKDIFDGMEAYCKFRQSKIGQRRLWIRWSGVAASIALLVAVSLWMMPERGVKQELSPSGVILPGHSHAVVTLAGGQQIALEKEIRKIEESDGTILHSGEGELVYKVSGKKEMSEIMYNTVMIPRGGEYRLVLSDGTKVWLNAETELRFPVNFSGDTRDVYLKGEAYFDVKRDTNQPFLVHSSMGYVKVLGTSFNVRDYVNEREVVTTLESGKVVYFPADLTKNVVLSPGYQVVDKGGDLLESRKVDPLQYTGWREGKYVFEDVTLENIMRTLTRWYDIEVVYTDSIVKNLHFTGDLERYESINVFLDFIETGGDVRFKTEGRKIIVAKK